MAGKTAISGEIIKSYLEQHPDMASLTLARKAYKENPELWKKRRGCKISNTPLQRGCWCT